MVYFIDLAPHENESCIERDGVLKLNNCLIIDIYIDEYGLYSHKIMLDDRTMTVPFEMIPTVGEILLSYQQFIRNASFYTDISKIDGLYFYVCNELTYFESKIDEMHEYISNINRFIVRSRESGNLDYCY